MGIGPIVDTARQGINAARAGMQLVSKNIASSSVDGYSRQDILFEAPLGNGVRPWVIRSQVDEFLESRLTTETQAQGKLTAQRDLLAEVTAVFGATDSGLNTELSQFFAAASALATTPEGSVERTQLLFDAQALTEEVQREYGQLQTIASQIDRNLASTVTRANALAEEIASLNTSIGATGDSSTAGELEDYRRVLVNELSGLIDINTFKDGNGGVVAFVGGGFPLVEGGNFGQLQLTGGIDGYRPHAGVSISINGGIATDLTGRITGGEIAGMLDVRDNVVSDAMDTLDRVSATLTYNVNQLHSAGYGLDGSTGNDFFSGMTATSVANNSNQGGVGAAVTISNMAAVTLDDYEIVFTSPTQFDVLNLTQGTTELSGVGYTSPSAFAVDGIGITLSNVSGAPQAGDKFLISTTRDHASVMGVGITDIQKIAAAGSVGAGPGDNSNMLQISALESANLTQNGTLTLSEKTSEKIAQIGFKQQAVEQAFDAQSAVMSGLELKRAEASGVSLDEEAARLIRYQHAFEANARLIRVADEMVQTIISMV
ncbi:MAG: flagellar hook-associated protein FlgK [Leptospirillia bacterium]